ncbi:MAG: ergothioneine biosynthesis protein EgtB [Actinomycetota bacterium]|nr:ergothioneine biosynthesis protein EgtB [Actinomycetota bacterium]
MTVKEVVARQLESARARSFDLLEPLCEADLVRQHSKLMSPVVWDLAHVGNYEDLWLVRALGASGFRPDLDPIYDAFRHPRANRPALPLLGPSDARSYVRDVRGRALDVLEQVEMDDPAHPLLADAFVYGMVVQHEHMHDETMLATLQLMDEPGYRTVAAPPPQGAPPERREVLVDGGTFTMGTDTEPWALDNERPSHQVELAPFLIDAAPVTNAAYAEFVDAGGYGERRCWDAEGWAWRQEAGLEHPQFWHREGSSSWSRTRFGWREDLPAHEPVQHVCWHEAAAYARWRGRRLPTEAEWEKAASSEPAAGRKRRYPWGDDEPTAQRANLGQAHLGTAPVGAYPKGASAYGCVQMTGDVWEWTSSVFEPYPGFRSFPYREYSEVFYGSDYRVLRGGSWATHPSMARTTFRNWDLPIRRQIFCGFRCARDA